MIILEGATRASRMSCTSTTPVGAGGEFFGPRGSRGGEGDEAAAAALIPAVTAGSPPSPTGGEDCGSAGWPRSRSVSGQRRFPGLRWDGTGPGAGRAGPLADGRGRPSRPAPTLLADVGEKDCFHPPGPLPRSLARSGAPRSPPCQNPTPNERSSGPSCLCFPSFVGREYRENEEGKERPSGTFTPS